MFERQSQISRGADNIRLDALLRTSDGQRHGSLDVGRIARLEIDRTSSKAELCSLGSHACFCAESFCIYAYAPPGSGCDALNGSVISINAFRTLNPLLGAGGLSSSWPGPISSRDMQQDLESEQLRDRVSQAGVEITMPSMIFMKCIRASCFCRLV